MKLVKKLMYWQLLGKEAAKDLIEKEKDNGTIKAIKKKRLEVEKKIDNMIAQIDQCGDRWFLNPIETIDDCVRKDLDDED